MKKKVIKRSIKRVPKKPVRSKWLLALVVITVVNVAYFLYQQFKPKPTDIFLVEESTLSYGQTTLTGVIQKDTSIDKVGLFLLVLPDSKVIILNQLGLELFVGSKVEVDGMLFPPYGTEPPLMRLDSIKEIK